MKIVERFLGKRERNSLLAEYNGHKHQGRGLYNRTTDLKKPLTTFEKASIDHYYNSTDMSMGHYAHESKKSVGECMTAVQRGTRKLVLHNMGTFSQEIR